MGAHCISVFSFTSPDVSIDFFARSVAQVTKSNSPQANEKHSIGLKLIYYLGENT